MDFTHHVLTYLLVMMACASSSSFNKRPNILIILVDDFGFADMSGNWSPQTVPSNTPYLESLADNGIRFVDFHAAASVCTPSRAALLTGRLGKRTGVTRNFSPFSVGGLPTNETTFAETFKSAGYRTGMVGKWHLGITKEFHPNSRGFDFYYGLPYSNDMGCSDDPGHNIPIGNPCPKDRLGEEDPTYPGVPLYYNESIVAQPVNQTSLSKRYAEMAVKFIKNEQDDKPFLLYVALTHMHVPLLYMDHFKNKSLNKGIYGDTLLEMDNTVQTIVSAVKEIGQEKNTLVWVAGDNGPWEAKCELGGDPSPFIGVWQKLEGGGGSTSKMTVWEGGHRVPAAVYWPGTIKGGLISEVTTSMLDIYPTIASLANVTLPGDRIYDGKDITDHLLGKPFPKDRVLYHPNSGALGSVPGDFGAVRVGDYKAVYFTGGIADCRGKLGKAESHHPPLIFNVREDPMESNPLDPGSKLYQSIYAGMKEAMIDINASLKNDNRTVADYTEDPNAKPCCNPHHVVCRCQD
ncbi:putative arylsulfatase G-like [Apostichopus japonicus]|uniref:Putative arylsulfatase G-like n=1 Tax=Stichopus japonicus TaxID=307972 RepID=A0A2G8JSK2_STIJA|nr:putative arylsulfatase G-like [Apostichopus japonicus]